MRKLFLNRYGFRLLCLMLLVSSCSKEQLTDDPNITTGSAVEMRLQVNAPLGSYVSDNENTINRLRMVIFGSIGSSDAGKLILNKYYATAPVGNELKEIITSGKRDIYIIVNEPLSGGGEPLDSYKNIAAVADVRNLSLVYQGAGSVEIYTPTEIPMFIEHTNQVIRLDTENHIGGAVERTMAKVTIKLKIKNSNFPTGKQVVIDNIQIKNLPQKSYLIAQNYTDALVASEKQNVAVVATVSGYNFSSNNTFYVPEYIFNNPEKGAYIEITGHVNGEANRISKWKVKLGDAMDDGKAYGDRYHITRNRHYTFTGDVKSYGEMDDLAVKVTVQPWNTVSQDDDVGRFIVYSSVTDAADKPIADGSGLDDMGMTLKVVCNTNIGGWYTITRDMNNKIVHRSSPTASVSVATSQTVNITIPPLTDLDGHKYTVNIYHPTLSIESIGPVKSLNFNQYGALIPRSVLEAYTGRNNEKWPVDRLPIKGLQLAKRGNLLPWSEEAAKDVDPQTQWSTERVQTGEAARGLGEGKDKYAQVSALDALKYPIGQACNHLGPEWYIASFDEMQLIYYSKNNLGSSYTFPVTTDHFWTITERGFDAAQTKAFNDSGIGGGIGASFKHNKLRVRCVREI